MPVHAGMTVIFLVIMPQFYIFPNIDIFVIGNLGAACLLMSFHFCGISIEMRNNMTESEAFHESKDRRARGHPGPGRKSS